MTKKQDAINRVRISESMRVDLLNRMDSHGNEDMASLAQNNRRADPRFEFRKSDTPAEIHHPGGSVTRVLVCMRNLSAGGAAFIYGGFLHPGSLVVLSLRSSDQSNQNLVGSVVGCRHVEGPYHEIRMTFEDRIDPRRYIEDAKHSTLRPPD